MYDTPELRYLLLRAAVISTIHLAGAWFSRSTPFGLDLRLFLYFSLTAAGLRCGVPGPSTLRFEDASRGEEVEQVLA